MTSKEELLNNLTVKQLKQLAKENNVSLVWEGLFFDNVASTKEEIVDVLLDSDKITKEKITTIQHPPVYISKQEEHSNSWANAENHNYPRRTNENTGKVALPNNNTQTQTQYLCNVCKQPISDKVNNYSLSHYGKPLCMTHQRSVIPQTCSCIVCKRTITEPVFKFSTEHFGAPLCMNHQKTVTPQAIRLSNALNSFEVKHELEYDDGHKHVDIAIEWAKLYLELDGSQHGFSPNQMCTDDERDKHSLKEGFVTKRIPNIWVDRDVDRLALSVATLANKRYREILENESKITFTGIVKSVFNRLSETLENFE
jgi:very-short-patch-repair endonuclease